VRKNGNAAQFILVAIAAGVVYLFSPCLQSTLTWQTSGLTNDQIKLRFWDVVLRFTPTHHPKPPKTHLPLCIACKSRIIKQNIWNLKCVLYANLATVTSSKVQFPHRGQQQQQQRRPRRRLRRDGVRGRNYELRDGETGNEGFSARLSISLSLFLSFFLSLSLSFSLSLSLSLSFSLSLSLSLLLLTRCIQTDSHGVDG
jgi:hypothetical protein